MTILSASGMFIIKAFIYGVMLGAGFWLAGKFTGYIDYYLYLFFNDKDRFHSEMNEIKLWLIQSSHPSKNKTPSFRKVNLSAAPIPS